MSEPAALSPGSAEPVLAQEWTFGVPQRDESNTRPLAHEFDRLQAADLVESASGRDETGSWQLLDGPFATEFDPDSVAMHLVGQWADGDSSSGWSVHASIRTPSEIIAHASAATNERGIIAVRVHHSLDRVVIDWGDRVSPATTLHPVDSRIGDRVAVCAIPQGLRSEIEITAFAAEDPQPRAAERMLLRGV